MKKLIVTITAILLFSSVVCFAATRGRYTAAIRSKGTATLTVAASNSTSASKRIADYRCDGTDDDLTIEAAIAALPTDVNGMVTLFEGTYSFRADSDIDITKGNVTLAGCGVSTLLTKIAGGSDVPYITIGDGTNPINNVIIKDMQIGDNIDYGSYGVYVETNALNCVILNCLITAKQGGVIGWSNGLIVDQCRLIGCGDEGVQLEADYCIITGCYFKGIGGNNPQDAIRIRDGNYNTVTGCVIVDCNSGGLTVAGNNNTITACTFHNNAQGGSQDYEIYLQRSVGVTCKDNIIGFCTINASSADYGIKEQSHSGVYNNSIINNVVLGAAIKSISITDEGTQAYDNVTDDYYHERKIKTYYNGSGGELVEGDLVVIKAVADGNQVDTTTAAGDDFVIGMAAKTIADGAAGKIQILGFTDALKVDGTDDIAIGDLLTAFTTAKIAQKGAAGEMAIAFALEAYATNDSSGVIDAILITPRKMD